MSPSDAAIREPYERLYWGGAGTDRWTGVSTMRRHQAHDHAVFNSPNFDMEAISLKRARKPLRPPTR
jgi:hypothetical protein